MGTNFAFAKKSIKQITSKQEAEKVAQEIPESIAPDRQPDRIHTHSVGVGVGQTILAGDFRDNADDSITADLLYTYRASHSFDMFADLHYSSHSFKKQRVTLSGLALGIKGKLFEVDSFSPFLLGGFGFYQPSAKRYVDGVLTSTKKKVTFGYHFGGGMELRLNNHYSIGVLIHYHNPFDVKQEVGTKLEGSYFKMLITAMYTF